MIPWVIHEGRGSPLLLAEGDVQRRLAAGGAMVLGVVALAVG